MSLRCPNIIYKGKQGMEKGEFRSNNEGFRWMGKSFKVSIKRDLMSDLEWTQIGPRVYQLKLLYAAEGSAKKTTIRFDGFEHHNYQELQTFVKNVYKKDIKNVPVSTKGWNWGDFEFKTNALLFTLDGKKGFELDYETIQHASIQTKNEVEIQLQQEEGKHGDCLTQMRIYIPSTEESASDAVPSQTFYDNLANSANLVIDQSKAIVQFKDIHLVTPRGRYAVDMYDDFLDLHGRTYSHKIYYEHIERMFLLDTPNEMRMFVVNVNPPLRQGQTAHHFMILRFEESKDMDLNLNLTQDQIDNHYKDQLAQELFGPASDVVSRVFKALVNKGRDEKERVKVLVPGNYMSFGKSKCIRCSLKANDGFLFPMKQSFFFLHKPTTYIRHSQIQNVEFMRVWGGGQGSNNKTFDFAVHMKNGDNFMFTGINRDEYENLFKFLSTRKVEIEDRDEHEKQMNSSLSKGTRTRGRTAVSALDDAYVKRLKNTRMEGVSDGEDSDSDDEDFANESESDSDDSEEYNSKSEPSDDEDVEMQDAEKKKKKINPPSASSSSSSSSSSAKRPRTE